jgi:hypothetical protein
MLYLGYTKEKHMPKEFSTWVSEMAGTIPDLSLVDRFEGDSLTELQKRMLIADLLVPTTTSEVQVDDWVMAFTVSVDFNEKGVRTLTHRMFSSIVGLPESRLYTETQTDEEASQWLNSFKHKVRTKGII